MHYSQYLLITFKVYGGRKNLFNVSSKLNLGNLFKNRFILIILVYASTMTVLSLFGKSNHFLYQNLILIPIIGQTLHFYLDSFIWKFSEEHNRNNTLKFLKDKI